MADSKQINKWVKEGTITKAQAKKMLADTSSSRKEDSSSKIIIAVSVIGSILLGLGAILFVASNWMILPDVVKILIFAGSTFCAYYIGFMFKYQKKNFPIVGASLIFLGALLFGATIFLIAQIYHINANNSTLVFVWLLGILPLVYVYLSIPIAVLACLLYYVWLGLFIFRGIMLRDAFADLIYLPVLILVAGVVLFGIGALHYASKRLSMIARTYRLMGINAVMLTLFILTFRIFSEHLFELREEMVISARFTQGFTIFLILAVIITAINFFFNVSKQKTNVLENVISIGLIVLASLFFFFPATTPIYTIIFNLVIIAIAFVLLFVGYNKEDMKLVNIGITWLALLIIVRYFDFFWDLLPRSLFSMVGGLILVLGGIALEKKRRELRKRFEA